MWPDDGAGGREMICKVIIINSEGDRNVVSRPDFSSNNVLRDVRIPCYRQVTHITLKHLADPVPVGSQLDEKC